jgi:hypothetical protein
LLNLLRIWIWPVWLAIAAALSVPLFRRELDESHPPAKLAGLIALVMAMSIWIRLRRKWPRAELFVLGMALLIPALVREPRATVTVAAMSAAALAFGRCACDWLKLSVKGRAGEIVTSAALGFSAWVAILIALGIGHALLVTSIAALIGIAILFCRRGLRRLLRSTMEISVGWNEPDAFTGMQTFAALVMIGCVNLVMLTPSIYYDAFATHLATAHYYELHHTLEPVPLMTYSGFPQGFELLMTAAGLFAGQAGEQMISPLFLMLTLAAIYALARELSASRQIATAGAVFGLAIPFMQWSGAVAKNDLMLAFLLLFALFAALRCWNTRAPGWLYSSAFAAAAAQNVKMSAIVATGPLAILLLFVSLRIAGRIRVVAVTLAIFLVFSAYWPVRNKSMFGSLLYPLNLDAVSTPGAVEDMKAPPATRAARLASLPWRLQFHGTWGFDGQNDTPLGLFFLLFMPACFWMRRRDWTPATIGCAFFAACYLLAWGLTVPILRYAAAPVAMLALWISAGLVRTLRVAPVWIRALLLGTVAYCHVYNWSVMASLGVKIERVRFLIGEIDADEFLRRMLASYPSAAWIRDHAQPGEHTLSVGNFARAYMGDPGQVNVILGEQGPFSIPNIRSELASRHYRYVLLPRAVNSAEVFAGLAVPELASADEHYLVFRIAQ